MKLYSWFSIQTAHPSKVKWENMSGLFFHNAYPVRLYETFFFRKEFLYFNQIFQISQIKPKIAFISNWESVKEV